MRFSTLPILAFLPFIFSVNLLIHIPPSTLVPSPSTLPQTTTASLTTLAQSFVAPLSASNSFSFRNVTSGSYLLDVHCPTHFFAPLRIDVATDGKIEAWRTFRGTEWSNKGEVISIKEEGAAKLLDVQSVRMKEYYKSRSGLDPEVRAEFEERQKSSSVSGLLAGGQPGANPIANFDAAAWLAGAGKDSPGAEKGVSR
ncbi:MAG: hypothetical protein M1818_003982 [Claussenomyces sp. TS43310]|nr:MAG: hypothetical protein M1818_003982 [Claussenomyces sp. TS43310]